MTQNINKTYLVTTQKTELYYGQSDNIKVDLESDGIQVVSIQCIQ